jgi:ribosome-associated translation inhibitor RaiA
MMLRHRLLFYGAGAVYFIPVADPFQGDFPMQIHFESQTPRAAPLAPWAEARARFVMRRLAWLLARVRLQLADLNGPRGGLDKRCRVELQADGVGTVVVSSVARNWHAAVDTALDRAARTLLRQRQRRQPALLRRRHAGPALLGPGAS